MKILIACEESGIVRDAFARRGHDAWSCDLIPSATPGNHLQCCALEAINRGGWDAMIGFPPCTRLSLSGARWCVDHWIKRKKGPDKWHDGAPNRAARAEAVSFFRALWEAPIPYIALENPMSMASTLVHPKTQEIHPWQFGHGECKTTWLWLKNLPRLVPTNIVDGREQRIWLMQPGENRARDRSRTFTGIAEAMAEQWSAAITQPFSLN